jgi:hypothetical protein
MVSYFFNDERVKRRAGMSVPGSYMVLFKKIVHYSWILSQFCWEFMEMFNIGSC